MDGNTGSEKASTQMGIEVGNKQRHFNSNCRISIDILTKSYYKACKIQTKRERVKVKEDSTLFEWGTEDKNSSDFAENQFPSQLSLSTLPINHLVYRSLLMKWRRKRMSSSVKLSLHSFLLLTFILILKVISSKTLLSLQSPTKRKTKKRKRKSKGLSGLHGLHFCIAAQSLHRKPRKPITNFPLHCNKFPPL